VSLPPPSATVASALNHHRAGRRQQALQLYREALRTDPADFHANHLLGVLLLQAGQHGQAAELLELATRLQPDAPDPWVHLGMVRRELQQLPEARQALERALELDLGLDAAWNNLGNVLQDLGDLRAAQAAYERLLTLAPRHAEGLFNLAVLLARQGRARESIEACRACLELEPGRAEAHGQLAENLLALGEPGGALEAVERGLGASPDHPELLYLRGFAQSSLGDLSAARDSLQAAVRVQPEHGAALAALLYVKRQLVDWDGAERLFQRFVTGLSRGLAGLTPFSFLAEDSSRAQQLECARLWTGGVVGRSPMPPRWPERPPSGDRLTIGYLSADYYRHPTAYLAAGLFEQHDRERFRVLAYSCGRDDASPIRRRLEAAFDEFVDIRALGTAEAAQRIVADGVEILVDLKGHTLEAATGVMAMRPAPVQVQYLGYPGSMGAGFIDYLLGDAVVTPAEHQADYDEHLVRLPGCYQVNDRRRPCPDRVGSRASLGLPEQGIVFCCFNNTWKFAPAMFGAWMEILRRVPGSVLWLLGRQSLPELESNLRTEAQARGLDPERLVLSESRPLEDYLALYHHADLFLDTLPYNAHTTASDALWMGCPVLTLQGETFAGRVGASLLRAVELPEMVTASAWEFCDAAVRLAGEPGRLAELRRHLVAGRHRFPLFDTIATTRHIEQAYAEIWRRHLAGTPGPFSLGS